MDEEDDDDIYAPDESTVPAAVAIPSNSVDNSANAKNGTGAEDEEEGEEVEEEGSDSVCQRPLDAFKQQFD